MARARATTPLALLLSLLLLAAVGPTTSLAAGTPASSAAIGRAVTATTLATQSALPAFPTLHTETDPQTSGMALTGIDPLVAGPEAPVTLSGTLDVARLGLELQGLSPDGASGEVATPIPSPTPTSAPGASPAPPPVTQPTVATVELRVGADEPATAEEVDAWLSAPGPGGGEVMASTTVTAGTDPQADRLPFTVTVADIDEWVRTAYGVLPVSLEVRLPGATEPAGVLRTFLPFQVRKEYEPLRVGLVVPLTVPRDLALVGELGEVRTAAWEALVGEEGELRERTRAAADPRVVWALDPALLEPGPAPAEPPAQDGADVEEGESPHPTPSPTGSTPSTGAATTPAGPSAGPTTSPTGTGPSGPTTDGPTPDTTDEPDAEDPGVREHRLRSEFAADLLEAVDGRTVLLLPRHDADTGALPDAGAGGGAADAVRTLLRGSLDVTAAHDALTAAGATVTPTVWPADGAWSAGLDAALAQLTAPSVDTTPNDTTPSDATPWTVLPSTTSLVRPPHGPFLSPAGLPVVPYDATLSRAAGLAHDESSTVTAGLALTAHALIDLDQRPGTVRHRVIALDRDSAATSSADELASVVDAVPWLELAPLGASDHDGDLLEAATTAEPPVLADDRALALATTTARLPVAASVRADTGANLATRGADVLDQLVSVRWRGAVEDWTTAYQPIGTDVSETFTGLTIPSRDISFLADSGLLRVTVENSLDTGIENATLDLTVEDPILRVESGPQPVEVGAASRTTVGFEAVSIASGRVDVTATLRAPDGTVLGEPTSFSVRVSPTSDWIYWVLGASAAGVIVIGVVRTVTRRRPSG